MCIQIQNNDQKIIFQTLQWVRDEMPNRREIEFVMKELMKIMSSEEQKVTIRFLERFRTVKVVG